MSELHKKGKIYILNEPINNFEFINFCLYFRKISCSELISIFKRVFFLIPEKSLTIQYVINEPMEHFSLPLLYVIFLGLFFLKVFIVAKAISNELLFGVFCTNTFWIYVLHTLQESFLFNNMKAFYQLDREPYLINPAKLSFYIFLYIKNDLLYSH